MSKHPQPPTTMTSLNVCNALTAEIDQPRTTTRLAGLKLRWIVCKKMGLLTGRLSLQDFSQQQATSDLTSCDDLNNS